MAGEQIATKVSLLMGDGGTPTETFTAIPGVVGIPTFPALDYPDIEVTALDSAGAEFIAGLGDAGEMSFTLNLRQKSSGTGYLAPQQTLEGYAGDRLLHNFRLSIAAPITRTYTFAAFVKTFQPSAPSANSAITANVVLRVSGAVTIA